jgi:hypothetical protein
MSSKNNVSNPRKKRVVKKTMENVQSDDERDTDDMKITMETNDSNETNDTKKQNDSMVKLPESSDDIQICDDVFDEIEGKIDNMMTSDNLAERMSIYDGLNNTINKLKRKIDDMIEEIDKIDIENMMMNEMYNEDSDDSEADNDVSIIMSNI